MNLGQIISTVFFFKYLTSNDTNQIATEIYLKKKYLLPV